MRSKLWILAVILPLFLNLTAVCTSAEMPEGYSDIVENLGEDVEKYLHEGIYSENSDEVGSAVTEMSKGEFWLRTAADIFEDELTYSIKLFSKLLAFVVLSAVFGAFGRSFSSEALSGAVRFCSTTAIFASVIHLESEHLMRVETFFDRLSGMMGAMIPVTGAIWAMGGNVGTASASTSALYVFMNVCQGVFAKSVLPVCCLFSALALCNSLSLEMGLDGLCGALKRTYTTFLGIIMTVLVASLASQTTLTSSADSMSARAAKLISANVIPVVGASVGDTLRTVATSVQYLKGVVGIGGIIFIALLLLPVLISLLLSRLAFLLSGGIADMLGCSTESKFLSELGGVYSIMIAVVSISSVMFIFALTIFSKTVVAVA